MLTQHSSWTNISVEVWESWELQKCLANIKYAFTKRRIYICTVLLLTKSKFWNGAALGQLCMYHHKNWGHVITAAAAVYIDAKGKTECMQLLMTRGNEVYIMLFFGGFHILHAQEDSLNWGVYRYMHMFQRILYCTEWNIHYHNMIVYWRCCVTLRHRWFNPRTKINMFTYNDRICRSSANILIWHNTSNFDACTKVLTKVIQYYVLFTNILQLTVVPFPILTLPSILATTSRSMEQRYHKRKLLQLPILPFLSCNYNHT